MLLKNNIFSGNLQMNIYIKPHNEDYFSVQFINGYNQQLLDCIRKLSKMAMAIPSEKPLDQFTNRSTGPLAP